MYLLATFCAKLAHYYITHNASILWLMWLLRRRGCLASRLQHRKFSDICYRFFFTVFFIASWYFVFACLCSQINLSVTSWFTLFFHSLCLWFVSLSCDNILLQCHEFGFGVWFVSKVRNKIVEWIFLICSILVCLNVKKNIIFSFQYLFYICATLNSSLVMLVSSYLYCTLKGVKRLINTFTKAAIGETIYTEKETSIV